MTPLQESQPSTMVAALYKDFNDPIEISQVPIPIAPTTNDGIIIQVKATGVCRSDWHGWKGHDDDIKKHGLPFVPGHEFSGIVAKIGSNVKNLEVGDRVVVPFILSCGRCGECSRGRVTICEDQHQPGFTMWGSFAEYVCIPRADRNVCRIPSSVTFVQAAALGCRFTTAYRAIVQRARLQKGETVGIFGVGGLGLSCVMIAKSQGARKIIAVDVSHASLQKAEELGATHVLNAEDKDCVRTKFLALTNGIGADITVDAAGFIPTCENAIWCTRRGGRMIQVGLLPGGQAHPIVPMNQVAGREIDLMGSHGFAAYDMPNILELVAANKLDPNKLVEKEVTLKEGVKALEDMNHCSPAGIIMITSFKDRSFL